MLRYRWRRCVLAGVLAGETKFYAVGCIVRLKPRWRAQRNRGAATTAFTEPAGWSHPLLVINPLHFSIFSTLNIFAVIRRYPN